jgi:imidazolonepropionase-like amidohydrolase
MLIPAFAQSTQRGAAATAVAIALLAASNVSLSAQEAVAIRAGKVITITGAEIENAVILVRDGLIEEVRADDADTPWNAEVIDASDKVVMPTWVLAHQSGGLAGGVNENLANVPFLTVEDAIDPSSGWYGEALRNGVGTIHNVPGNATLIGGLGRIVRPYGRTVTDMTVRTEGALKMSLEASSRRGPVAQIQRMRRALEDVKIWLDDYERRKKEWEEAKAAGAVEEDSFPEKIDPTKKPVVELLQKKARAFLYVPSPIEVAEAQRMIEEYGIDVVLVCGEQTWRAADRLAEIGAPVVLDTTLEFYEKDPITEEESLVCLPAALNAAGVRFALSISDGTRGAQHYPWWQIATCVRHGVDRATALRSLTIEPAKILGLDAEIGSIEPGKVANLQILTGDPFEATTWVDSVLLDGEVVYRRSEDRRLQHLFGTER